MASVRSCEKLPPWLIKPVPAGSKTDLPLAKAKPVRDSGSASVRTYLRRGRKKWGNVSRERGVRRCERNNSADTKVSEEGGGRRCPKCRSREPSLAACDEDHGEAGCPPVVHGAADPPAAHGRDPTPEQGDA